MIPSELENPSTTEWDMNARQCLSGPAACAPTPLIRLPVPGQAIQLFAKDESILPLGSIKYRLAREIIHEAVALGQICQSTKLYDASAGSTAIAEAAISQKLGLHFTAVLPRGTSPAKVNLVKFHGGDVLFAEDLEDARAIAAKLGASPGARYLDQFGFAARYDGSVNSHGLGFELFEQVVSATSRDLDLVTLAVGTGHSMASVVDAARVLKKKTLVCLADPEASDLLHIWSGVTDDAKRKTRGTIVIEGIGGRDRPGFRPASIDLAIAVTDENSIAGARALSHLVGKRVGGSSGTAFWALFEAVRLHDPCEEFNAACLIYDDGERYRDTIFCDHWVASQGMDPTKGLRQLSNFLGVDCSGPLS